MFYNMQKFVCYEEQVLSSARIWFINVEKIYRSKNAKGAYFKKSLLSIFVVGEMFLICEELGGNFGFLLTFLNGLGHWSGSAS